MSRADIAPLVGFMQRQAHKPMNAHLKYINCVLRYIVSVSRQECTSRNLSVYYAFVGDLDA
eukprot:8400753-Prorocentrum_lima.AAC.1